MSESDRREACSRDWTVGDGLDTPCLAKTPQGCLSSLLSLSASVGPRSICSLVRGAREADNSRSGEVGPVCRGCSALMLDLSYRLGPCGFLYSSVRGTDLWELRADVEIGPGRGRCERILEREFRPK